MKKTHFLCKYVVIFLVLTGLTACGGSSVSSGLPEEAKAKLPNHCTKDGQFVCQILSAHKATNPVTRHLIGGSVEHEEMWCVVYAHPELQFSEKVLLHRDALLWGTYPVFGEDDFLFVGCTNYQ